MMKKDVFKKEPRIPIENWQKLPSYDWFDGNLENLESLKVLQIHMKLTREYELENIFTQNKKDIMELSKNWDGYGAPSIKENTLERVFELLKQIYSVLWEDMIEIPIPLIQPVPDGSIDINWETDQFELLINVPKDQNLLVNLYGEKLGHPQDEIEHRSHYDLISKVIIGWLKKIH